MVIAKASKCCDNKLEELENLQTKAKLPLLLYFVCSLSVRLPSNLPNQTLNFILLQMPEICDIERPSKEFSRYSLIQAKFRLTNDGWIILICLLVVCKHIVKNVAALWHCTCPFSVASYRVHFIYSVHRKIFRLSNFSLINFPMVRAASL